MDGFEINKFKGNMSITIESSDNREYFRKQGYARFYDFYTQYIPKHLPKWGTPDENGLQMDWTNSFEGYISVIDFMVDDAIDKIIERPEDKVVQFHFKALKNAIDLWTPEWDKEFAIYAISTFHSLDAPQTSDAYMTLWTMAYMNDEKEPIESFKWISDKIDLSGALDTLQPLSHLFRDNSLEGLKMALSGSNIYAMEGCIAPSSGNQRAVLYLIYKLADNGLIQETGNMEETAKVLISPNCSYRREKSLFSKGEYTLAKPKENQIETLVDSLSEL